MLRLPAGAYASIANSMRADTAATEYNCISGLGETARLECKNSGWAGFPYPREI